MNVHFFTKFLVYDEAFFFEGGTDLHSEHTEWPFLWFVTGLHSHWLGVCSDWL